MADKKAQLRAGFDNIFAKTAPGPDADQAAASGPTLARGVGLKQSEWQDLESIAAELGLTLHAVSAYGLRYFLKQYKSGAIQPESKPTLPGL